MKAWLHGVPLACVLFVGCVPDLFPREVLEGIDRNFDFARWRTVPSQIAPTKVEVGGRIIETQSLGDIMTIVVAQLPIVHYPAYGPKQGKSKGEFVITHHGKVGKPFLNPGNRLMVVGVTHGTKLAAVDDVMRSLPNIQSNCIHIWKTGDVDIADYVSSGAGYGVLEEETFCSGK